MILLDTEGSHDDAEQHPMKPSRFAWARDMSSSSHSAVLAARTNQSSIARALPTDAVKERK